MSSPKDSGSSSDVSSDSSWTVLNEESCGGKSPSGTPQDNAVFLEESSTTTNSTTKKTTSNHNGDCVDLESKNTLNDTSNNDKDVSSKSDSEDCVILSKPSDECVILKQNNEECLLLKQNDNDCVILNNTGDDSDVIVISDSEDDLTKPETQEQNDADKTFLTFEEYIAERALEHDYEYDERGLKFDEMMHKDPKKDKKKIKKTRAKPLGALAIMGAILSVAGIAFLCLPSSPARKDSNVCAVRVNNPDEAIKLMEKYNVLGKGLNSKMAKKVVYLDSEEEALKLLNSYNQQKNNDNKNILKKINDEKSLNIEGVKDSLEVLSKLDGLTKLDGVNKIENKQKASKEQQEKNALKVREIVNAINNKNKEDEAARMEKEKEKSKEGKEKVRFLRCNENRNYNNKKGLNKERACKNTNPDNILKETAKRKLCEYCDDSYNCENQEEKRIISQCGEKNSERKDKIRKKFQDTIHYILGMKEKEEKAKENDNNKEAVTNGENVKTLEVKKDKDKDDVNRLKANANEEEGEFQVKVCKRKQRRMNKELAKEKEKAIGPLTYDDYMKSLKKDVNEEHLSKSEKKEEKMDNKQGEGENNEILERKKKINALEEVKVKRVEKIAGRKLKTDVDNVDGKNEVKKKNDKKRKEVELSDDEEEFKTCKLPKKLKKEQRLLKKQLRKERKKEREQKNADFTDFDTTNRDKAIKSVDDLLKKHDEELKKTDNTNNNNNEEALKKAESDYSKILNVLTDSKSCHNIFMAVIQDLILLRLTAKVSRRLKLIQKRLEEQRQPKTRVLEKSNFSMALPSSTQIVTANNNNNTLNTTFDDGKEIEKEKEKCASKSNLETLSKVVSEGATLKTAVHSKEKRPIKNKVQKKVVEKKTPKCHGFGSLSINTASVINLNAKPVTISGKKTKLIEPFKEANVFKQGNNIFAQHNYIFKEQSNIFSPDFKELDIFKKPLKVDKSELRLGNSKKQLFNELPFNTPSSNALKQKKELANVHQSCTKIKSIPKFEIPHISEDEGEIENEKRSITKVPKQTNKVKSKPTLSINDLDVEMQKKIGEKKKLFLEEIQRQRQRRREILENMRLEKQRFIEEIVKESKKQLDKAKESSTCLTKIIENLGGQKSSNSLQSVANEVTNSKQWDIKRSSTLTCIKNEGSASRLSFLGRLNRMAEEEDKERKKERHEQLKKYWSTRQKYMEKRIEICELLKSRIVKQMSEDINGNGGENDDKKSSEKIDAGVRVIDQLITDVLATSKHSFSSPNINNRASKTAVNVSESDSDNSTTEDEESKPIAAKKSILKPPKLVLKSQSSIQQRVDEQSELSRALVKIDETQNAVVPYQEISGNSNKCKQLYDFFFDERSREVYEEDRKRWFDKEQTSVVCPAELTRRSVVCRQDPKRSYKAKVLLNKKNI